MLPVKEVEFGGPNSSFGGTLKDPFSTYSAYIRTLVNQCVLPNGEIQNLFVLGSGSIAAVIVMHYAITII